MSHLQTSDHLPAWARDVPETWAHNWIKWSVRNATARPTEDEQAVLPYISNEDIESWTGKLLHNNPQPSEGVESRKFLASDVLLNKLRPYLAKVYQAEFDGVSSGELLCLRPYATVLPRFLFYVVSSKGFIDTIDAETFGSKMPRADWGTIGHQPLPLPALATQLRIVRFLDEKTARIDALIKKKRALLNRLAEKRQALITHAVTKGLHPDASMKPCGVDWLGDIPAQWTIAPLGYRYQIQLGRMLNAERANGEDMKRYLRVFDVQWGKISVDDLPMMDVPPSSQPRYRLQPGDLLVNEGGSYIGRSAIWQGELAECYYQKALHRIRPLDKKLDSAEFLYFIMEMATKSEVFVAGGNQTTIDHLTAEQLRHYKFPFPPFNEQIEIKNFLQQKLAEHDALKDRIARSILRLEEYRAAVITAAVTGRLHEIS